jgi:hypothetical protein
VFTKCRLGGGPRGVKGPEGVSTRSGKKLAGRPDIRVEVEDKKLLFWPFDVGACLLADFLRTCSVGFGSLISIIGWAAILCWIILAVFDGVPTREGRSVRFDRGEPNGVDVPKIWEKFDTSGVLSNE